MTEFCFRTLAILVSRSVHFVSARIVSILQSPERFVEFRSVDALGWNKVIDLYICVSQGRTTKACQYANATDIKKTHLRFSALFSHVRWELQPLEV